MEELSAIGATAVAVTLGIQMLKRWRWFPWLDCSATEANRAVGAIAAALVGLGLHFHYDPSAGGAILLPSLPNLIHGIGHCLGQWGAQQLFYKTALAETDPVLVRVLSDVSAALRQPPQKGS